MAKSQAFSFRIYPKAVQKVNKIFDECWGDVMASLDIELENVIRDPNAFKEQGFVDQDIVDTGRFVTSQSIKTKQGETTFVWGAKNPKNGFPYPIALYTGYRAWGKKYIPGRKWPEKAVQRVNIPFLLASKMKARKINVQIKKLQTKIFK